MYRNEYRRSVARLFATSGRGPRRTRVAVEQELLAADSETGAAVPIERVRAATAGADYASYLGFEPGGQVELSLPHPADAATLLSRLRRDLASVRADCARAGVLLIASPVDPRPESEVPLQLCAPRYLATAVPPFLLLAAVGLGHAGRLGVAGLVLAVVLSVAVDGPPGEKSNVRDVAEAVAPSLRPGDLVVATQPEQVPVLSYYLPAGLRYATLTGPVRDLGVTDWRDGVARLQRTSARRDLAPLLDRLRTGQRLVLVQPIIYDLKPWSAPWTELVRLRSEEWTQYLSNDRRLGVTLQHPTSPLPRRPIPVQATVYLKTA